MQDGTKVGWRNEIQNGVEEKETGEEPAAGIVPAQRRRSNEVRL
jgi:hypothetical protein